MPPPFREDIISRAYASGSELAAHPRLAVGDPAPPDAIWHYLGFPSLVTYGIAYDYFFSGHTATIGVLAATELARVGKRCITVGAIGIVV